MFRFNCSSNSYSCGPFEISIQHLFRFNVETIIVGDFVYGFQYNTCFGSIIVDKILSDNPQAFQYNTCFGSIEVIIKVVDLTEEFQYNTCFGSIFSPISIPALCSKFQYNTCFGSILIVSPEREEEANFNTTLVSVQCALQK